MLASYVHRKNVKSLFLHQPLSNRLEFLGVLIESINISRIDHVLSWSVLCLL